MSQVGISVIHETYFSNYMLEAKIMNARKTIPMVALVVLVASAVRAVPDDPVYFADENLKQACQGPVRIC